MKPRPSSSKQKAAPDASSPSQQGNPGTHESTHLELAALWSMLDQEQASSAPNTPRDHPDASPSE